LLALAAFYRSQCHGTAAVATKFSGIKLLHIDFPLAATGAMPLLQ
jgi:hypothetical protein